MGNKNKKKTVNKNKPLTRQQANNSGSDISKSDTSNISTDINSSLDTALSNVTNNMQTLSIDNNAETSIVQHQLAKKHK